MYQGRGAGGEGNLLGSRLELHQILGHIKSVCTDVLFTIKNMQDEAPLI